ncbi:RNA-directed DNA polymerase, eukaryota [Tanacetum coccineum]
MPFEKEDITFEVSDNKDEQEVVADTILEGGEMHDKNSQKEKENVLNKDKDQEEGEINENSAKNSSPSWPLGFESHLRKPPPSPMADSTAAEGQGEQHGFPYAGKEDSVSKSFKNSEKEPSVGFSILQRLEEAIVFGKTFGINMDGCMRSGENKGKKGWHKKLCHEYSINFLGIQETKMVNMDLLSIRSIWGNSHFDYASSLARGLSGGCSPESCIHCLVNRFNGVSIIMGDFNVVRYPEERFGSQFDSNMTNDFNDFIEENDLIDPPLGGYQYIWVNKMATKMSKIDRFLLSEGVTDSFPNIVATILDKGIPDHRPIMLHEVTNDYGPNPFRFFHSWLDCADFEELVTTSWTSDYSGDLNPMNLVKKNGKKADLGMASKEELNARQGFIKDLATLNNIENLDLAQKARIRWNVEGDENSMFFHRVINRKRRVLSIRGFKVDGEISEEQRSHLEANFTNDKVKQVVWDCGSDKSPGPDGFTFDFFKRFCHVLQSDIVRAVTYFHRSNKFPKGCNYSFITLIPKVADLVFIKDYKTISLIGSMYKIIGKLLANRLAKVVGDLISSEQSAFVKGKQIMDGPMILNEILNWCKKEKRKTLVFKVEFEKAYDTVCWDFLQEVMAKMGFGLKWCAWIRGYLTSSRASVLVNRSPTDEFLIHIGLRQGDPLSLFLFILVMEALHMLIERAKTANLVHRIRLDMAGIVVSHLFYADDAIFLGEWSETNVNNIMLLLQCFFLASGLKINLGKCILMGVGANMNRIAEWDEVIKKFKTRLSTWKAKTLSVGGRLTLIKSVLGSIAIYYMSIFKTPITVVEPRVVDRIHLNPLASWLRRPPMGELKQISGMLW